MKKVLIVLALLVPLAITVLIVAGKMIKASNRDNLSIVRLVYNNHTFCSGTVLNKHTILTATHCVEAMNFMPIEIRFSDNLPRGTIGTIRYGYGQPDISLLEGDFSAFPFAEYEADALKLIQIQKIDSQVELCGYAMGGQLFCNLGLVKLPYVFGTLTTARGIPAMSGGPVFDANGVVIGVVDAALNEYSLFIPLYNIGEFIK